MKRAASRPTQCKWTSIFARKETRRSHAMERSPSRSFSTSPTMVRRQLKKTRYRRCDCRLDQLFDRMDIWTSGKISMLHRCPKVSSAQDEVQVAEIRDHA